MSGTVGSLRFHKKKQMMSLLFQTRVVIPAHGFMYVVELVCIRVVVINKVSFLGH